MKNEQTTPVLKYLCTVESLYKISFRKNRNANVAHVEIIHSMFLEWWNTTKSFDSIFHAYLTRGLQKYARNLIPTMAFWGQTKAGQKIAARLAGLAAQVANVGPMACPPEFWQQVSWLALALALACHWLFWSTISRKNFKKSVFFVWH